MEIAKKPHSVFYYLIQMFLSFGQNLSYQFMPIFVRKLGADPIQMSLLTSFSNVFSTLFSPFFGNQSDKFGRRTFITLGALVGVGAGVSLAISHTVFQALFSAAISAFGMSILIPAWSGAMADYTTDENRGGFIGRIMGVGPAFVTMCLTLFAIFSQYLPYNELTQYRLIMYVSAGNFLLVTLVSYLFLDYKNIHKSKDRLSMWVPLKDNRFRSALVVILIWWLFMSFAWSYFPLLINDVLKLTAGQVAIIGIAQTITQAISSYRGADIIDRIGARKAVIIGFLPFSLIPLLFALSTQWWHLIFPQLIGGFGIGFGFSALQVYILNIAGSERAGTYQGLYNVLFGVLTFGGTLLGGIILDSYSKSVGLPSALFVLLIIIAGLRFLTNFLMIRFLPSV